MMDIGPMMTTLVAVMDATCIHSSRRVDEPVEVIDNTDKLPSAALLGGNGGTVLCTKVGMGMGDLPSRVAVKVVPWRNNACSML